MCKRFLWLAVVVCCCLPLVACGPANPKTYKVTGTVTYNGQAVADANVAFAAENSSKTSTGKTDAQGKFTLMTFKAGDGALPGKNKATVVKNEAVKETDPAAMMEAMKKSGGIAAPMAKPLLPAYAATDAGTFEVATDKPNDFTIELKDP